MFSDPVLNFFTVATGKYRIFIIPYITSALFFNKNAVAEIITDRPDLVRSVHKNFLNKHFRNRWMIREVDSRMKNWIKVGKKAKSVRWLSIPTVKAKYTYIGDIDILILESNIEKEHVLHTKFINKPYSNMVRNHPTKKKMTGLHFVVTDEYYSKMNSEYVGTVINKIRKGEIRYHQLDECLLYKIVKNRFGLPSNQLKKGKESWEDLQFRPSHGIHISFGRRIAGWGVLPNRLRAYEKLAEAEVWKDAYKVFAKDFRNKIDKIYIAHRERMKEIEEYHKRLAAHRK